MKRFVSFVLSFVLLLLVAAPLVSAADTDIVINEFSSSGDSDWIEVFNLGSSAIDLGNYRIRDSTATNKLDLTGNIDPGGFKVFEWGNKLNNSGDTIKLVLKSSEDSPIDLIEYGTGKTIPPPTDTQTGGRQPDGVGEWKLFSSGTREISNNSSTESPSPTPVPSNTPTNTPAPTATRTPTPIKTPTPTKAPTPTRTPTPSPLPKTPTQSSNKSVASSKTQKPTPTISHGPIPTAVLGAQTKADEPNPTSTPTPTKIPTKVLGFSGINPSFYFIFGGIIVLGVCGGLVYINYKRGTL